MRIGLHGVEVDDCIGHRCEVRGLGDEELLPVATEPKDFALHCHEHALVLGVEGPIGLVGEERVESPPGVLGQVQGDRPGQALVDPLCRDAGYAEFAIRPALPPLQLRRRYLRSDAA